ncbi:hypothetical protein GTA08_BOTSDO13050 [Botryosphaeria dothidea]|uniref:Uncharacterized protein n=1 Tax=Botryosphaeria dothidea TaxID=55169 RepID=A0A8H4NDL4_9PEZI|nr:hypothetical protein GTA08_BOTSDO13050 [Botryosphaeria dothidea]
MRHLSSYASRQLSIIMRQAMPDQRARLTDLLNTVDDRIVERVIQILYAALHKMHMDTMIQALQNSAATSPQDTADTPTATTTITSIITTILALPGGWRRLA